MRKYNLSNIMKRAWELVKKAGMTISSGLKKAWEEAKNMGKELKGSEKQIAWANDIIREARETLSRNIEISEEREAKTGNTGFYRLRIESYKEVQRQLETYLDTVDSAAKIIERKSVFSSESVLRMAQEYEKSLRKNR